MDSFSKKGYTPGGSHPSAVKIMLISRLLLLIDLDNTLSALLDVPQDRIKSKSSFIASLSS